MPSRGFLCALAGIGLTIFSWYGPWAWPAWPAFAVMKYVLGDAGFADLSYRSRSLWIVALIAVNVATWALVTGVLFSAAARSATIRRRK